MSDYLQTTFKIRDHNGNAHDVNFHAQEYETAKKAGLTLTQYLTQKYGGTTDETKYGSVVGQMMASSGMFMGEDYRTGLKSPTMKDVVTDGISLSSITRNDGSDNHSPSGRLLFPEIIMRTVESQLRESNDDFLNGWESMIAQTTSISGQKFDQPIINVTAPEAQSANPISQLAEPDALVSITVSDTSHTITTKSIGLMISDQAQSATTLDLVNIILAAHARGERVRMVEEHLNGIVSGDTDRGMSALAVANSSTIETGVNDLTDPANLTHTFWIKYLRQNYKKMSINAIITTLDVALALEGRSGKPRRDTVYSEGSNFPIDMSVDNLAINAPRILIVDDGVIAADTIVGLDTRYAIRRVINVEAAYSAIENYLMRRATGLRLDYGEFSHRLYDDAFSVVTGA